MEDPEDMVQKGVGWFLKETYPGNQEQTLSFLKPWTGQAPHLAVRLAAEKLSPEDRAVALKR